MYELWISEHHLCMRATVLNIKLSLVSTSGAVSYLCKPVCCLYDCLYFSGCICVCVCPCSRICVRTCESAETESPRAALQLPAAPSSHLWLGGSWGLTFHFSDPLFHRANSYAGLEMCYVAGWDKNQGQFQNNLWPLSQGYFCSLPLLPIHLDDLISIMSLAINKDMI